MPPAEEYAQVYFDIAIGGRNLGRVTFKLYRDTPLCSENFRCLLEQIFGIFEIFSDFWNAIAQLFF